MKTFKEANQLLRRYWPDALSRRTYSLERMMQLMDYLGNPQDKTKVIHVAGTSGKTSTSYYAAALLGAAGKHVGLSVSPHVDEVNERVQLGLVPLPEAEFCRQLGIFLALIPSSGLQPNYFELMVAFAFWQFAQAGVEYVVMEVGFGGLLDVTNVVTRQDKVCVITDIGMDHVDILGATLQEIASQKAGIIQLYNSVFCYQQDRVITDRIRQAARQKQADLHVLGAEAVESRLPDLPLFQQRNLGLAQAAVEYVLARDGHAPLTNDMVARAAQTHIPARMEVIKRGGKTIIIDGAHNAQKFHALRASIQHAYTGQPIAALVSFAAGHDYRLEDAAAELAPLLSHLIVTTFGGPQDGPKTSVAGGQLAQVFKHHGAQSVEIVTEPQAALQTLLNRPEPILLVAGSFYLLNHIRPFFW